MQPEVSIIIVNYNTREVLRACLDSIAQHAGLAHETIVVDNASNDASAEMVRADFPWVRLIANTGNAGFSPANNMGMAHAQGEWLVLLNPDTALHARALATWLNDHRAHDAAISGPRLLNTDGSLQPSAWKVPVLRSAFLELIGFHRILGAHHYPTTRFSSDFEPGFVSGAAMLFHRQWFQRSGGLDPQLFWSEDTDLCMRIRAQGGRCWFVHRPTITHIGGESAKRNPRRAISNQLLSRLKLARKHRGWLAHATLALIIGAHIISRSVVFSLIALVRSEPRGDAYRYTLKRYWRYLIHGDLSI
ncbi:MAG: glycosyltransferase family 2 protein [Flavobacteriales bacterium]